MKYSVEKTKTLRR